MNDRHHGSSVEITENGRSGSVVYRESSGSLSFYWEFGGGDTIAVITAGDLGSWGSRPAWAQARRAEILQRVADEAIRQKAPGAEAEIDLRAGFILIRPRKAAPHRPAGPSAVSGFDRYKFKAMLAALGLIVGGVAIAVKVLFSGPVPKGIPVAASVRASDSIFTLIRTQESYIPSLHRNPDNDRFRLDLFVFPVNGSSPGRMIRIGRGYRVTELQLARILGFDGHQVWCAVDRIAGVELASGRLVGADELRRANPQLGESWDDPRRFSFGTRLRLSTPDRRQTYAIDPESLQAVPVEKDPPASQRPFGIKLEDFLSSGVRPSPVSWLGLHSSREAAVEFKPKSWLRPLNRATSAKEERRFYHGDLGPELAKGNREILSLSVLTEETYLNAAFVRAGPDGDPIRMSDPDGFLFIYTSAPGLAGTLVVARVDTAGKMRWKTDTGLDRFKLQQILPGERHLAFVGPQLPIPNQVSPVMLAIVDTQTGALLSTSLHR